MTELVNISVGTAAGYALLGYAVVFFGLVLLLAVVKLMTVFTGKKAAAPAPVSSIPAPDRAAPVEQIFDTRPQARGTAGELKLYDTDPRDAAMIMAIVADSLGKPLNELRFISIREVKEDEV